MRLYFGFVCLKFRFKLGQGVFVTLGKFGNASGDLMGGGDIQGFDTCKNGVIPLAVDKQFLDFVHGQKRIFFFAIFIKCDVQFFGYLCILLYFIAQLRIFAKYSVFFTVGRRLLQFFDTVIHLFCIYGIIIIKVIKKNAVLCGLFFDHFI